MKWMKKPLFPKSLKKKRTSIKLKIKDLRFKIFFLFNIQYSIFNIQYSFSQTSYLPLERDVTANYENHTSSKEIQFHSSVKPFLHSDLNQWLNVDSLENSKNIFKKFFKKNTPNSQLPTPNSIEISPLFFLSYGKEMFDTSWNVRGTAIGASLNAGLWKKLFINANFLSANSAFPSFVNHYTDSMKIVPAEGYAHPTKLGYHYKNFSGYISYSPSKIFNLQLGHGKNFIGDGYRSLLLSDVANNYSFFKITTTIWKIKYVNIFANFKDVRGGYKDYWHFKDKFGTFHYLSWNATRWLNLGLFESVIWQAKDTLNNRGYDVNYLNPVIFYRPVEYSLGSSDNVLMGTNFKIKVTDKIQLYGQFVLDEFLLSAVKARNGWWANKYGGQFGFKYFDMFGEKGLSFQAEFNEVRPYTYSHGSTLQNYAHFNQPLAHPLGANFSEVLGILRYEKKSFSIEGKSIIAKFGTDIGKKNYGGDIYKSYDKVVQQYGNKTGQGLANYLMVNEIKASYLVYPKMNLKIEAGVLSRVKYVSSDFQNNLYFFLGLRTSLYNVYRDFM